MSSYTRKQYRLGDVKPGMEVGKDVLTDSGQIMLLEGIVLTEAIIEGLDCWDISSIYIREKVVVKEEPTPIKVEAPVKVEIPLSENQQKFYNNYDDTTNTIKSAFENMRYFKEAPLEEMKELSDNAIFPMLESIGVINNLHMVRRQNDYTFHHSVNVAVICGVLGKWLGYTKANLSDLVLAGLLHDIGKTQIPLEILNKPDKLTAKEMEIMQTHTTLGYKLIKENKILSPTILYAILQHHERMDGSGYPFKIKADKIHDYAKIIAVADTYDAMTSNRVYHSKVTPFAVVETMAGEMYNKLDPTICTVFLNNVRNYFIGNTVKLDDGRSAEVVFLGQFMGTRPTVCTQDGEFIDLERNKSIRIVELMEA